MKTLRMLSEKAMFSLGAILVFVGIISTAPHTWIFCHEEECPEELLRNE